MLMSLALIFLVGMSLGAIFNKIKVPKIIGMLLAGMLLGPYILDLLDPKILGISTELRRIALVIILIKAGLTLDLKDLKKVGRPALLMTFLPASAEILACTCFAPLLMGVSWLEAAVIGAVLGAVSPAVVVPKMVQLIENGYGTKKGVPQMILAGASLDDVYVIVMFTSLVNMLQGASVDALAFAGIPVSIVLGVLLGLAAGLLLGKLFEVAHARGVKIRNSLKVIIVFGAALLLASVESLKGVPIAGLLAVISLACTIKMLCRPETGRSLADKFGKLWLGAELLLFVLVGAAVNLSYLAQAGIASIALIFISLAFRSLAVFCCLLGTGLNAKERLFCVLAYLPKATVQAAIGSVPLGLGLACGNTVLTIAVLAIIITAPLGAFSMEITYKKLLEREE